MWHAGGERWRQWYVDVRDELLQFPFHTSAGSCATPRLTAMNTRPPWPCSSCRRRTISSRFFNDERPRVPATKPRAPGAARVCRLLLSATAFGALLLLPAFVRAQDQANEATAHVAEGRVLVTPLRSISASEMRWANSPHRLRWRTSCGSIFGDIAARRLRARLLIELANGDRIAAGLTSMSDEAVVALWNRIPIGPRCGFPPRRSPES